jgi:hypothetical protein
MEYEVEVIGYSLGFMIIAHLAILLEIIGLKPHF